MDPLKGESNESPQPLRASNVVPRALKRLSKLARRASRKHAERPALQDALTSSKELPAPSSGPALETHKEGICKGMRLFYLQLRSFYLRLVFS